MNSRQTALAAAAALLFTGGAGTAAADSHAEGEKIKCEGVNECSGHSACKTLLSECAGQNACKGKGFVMLTPEECETAKAEMEEKDEG